MRAGVRVLLVLAAFALAGVPARSQTAGVDELLARVAARISEYYRRAQSVICTERSVVQPIGAGSYSPEGFARIVESELHVEADAGDEPGEAKFVREVRKVNGRPPREKDRKDRAGCTDPNPLSIEPLAFLLPAHRSDYVFTAGGPGKDKNRAAMIIDFVSTTRKSSLELRNSSTGIEDCFGWEGDVAVKGRVWVDAATYDVLRVDERFNGRVDVKVPFALQQRHNLSNFMAIERYDSTIRYRTVAFHDPEEALLLPESVDLVMIVRGGLTSTRRNQTFSDYRRFLTGGRVVK
jgi:hypothetical protein